MISVLRLVLCLLLCLLPRVVCANMSVATLLQRADSYYAAGRYLEALSFYRDCANNSDTDAHRAAAFFGLGLLFDRYLDDCGQALDYYGRYVTLQGSHSARALHYSARILARMLRREEAGMVYRELLQSYPAYAVHNAVQAELDLCVGAAAEMRGLFDRVRFRDMSGMVRVLIEDQSGPVKVKGCAGLLVADNGSENSWTRHDRALVFRADNDSLFVNGTLCEHGALIVRGDRNDRLQVNGRWYRSWVSVRAEMGRVMVINHVCLEHYLYGVLPREIYVSWPAAALQAQAVAARTYALYHMIVRKEYNYDVLSTTSSQVYGGLDREHPATNDAVDATRALVLISGGKLVLALYHANSGGAVEAVEDVWDVRLPYLRGVLDTPSLQGRGVQWTCTLSAFEVTERLGNFGIECNNLESMKTLRRSGSGRVQQIALTGRGAAALISGNSLRLMLGPAVVKSTRFIVESAAGTFRLSGTGYGHGVGMSQWGAYTLAMNGADFRTILAHYYPGTDVIAWAAGGRPCSARVR